MTSTRVLRSAATIGVLLASASAAKAQTCAGMGSYTLSTRSVSTFAGGVGSERLAVGRFGIASSRAFGGVQVGYGGNTGLNKPQTAVLGLDAGFSRTLGATGIEVCPLAQSLYERGRVYSGMRNHNMYNSLGLAVGRAITFNNSFALVPFVDARLLAITRKNTGSFVSPITGQGPSAYTIFGGQYTVGLGFRFGELLTIRPAVGLRSGFGGGEDQGAMSISASYNFRR